MLSILSRKPLKNLHFFSDRPIDHGHYFFAHGDMGERGIDTCQPLRL